MPRPNQGMPSNIQAEDSLLGACLLSTTALETALKVLSPSDFYKPANGTIFNAMVKLWNEGQPLDPVTVSNQLRHEGLLDSIGGSATLVTLQTTTPSTTNAGRYANIVVEMALYRRTITIADSLIEDCYGLAGDPNDLIEAASAEFASMGIRIGDIPKDLWQLDEFLDRPEAMRPDWCVPGICRKGWRIMVVAGEGVGKTVLFRQIGMAAAQGIHPLKFHAIPPIRVLIVDLENPEDSILDVCNPIRDRVYGAAKDYDPERAWLWHRPSGINLRNRADRLSLEAVIMHTNPDLVCLGPLYKAYEVNARENDELAAREVMTVLDDLRTRYNFGLLMEHHAPKESGGSKRKMMPYGSSLWLRWPEMGIALTPEGQGLETLTVGRWRGDRLENEWPIKLHRSQTWPWQGEFDLPRAARPAPNQPSGPVGTPAPQSVNDFPSTREELDDYDDEYELDDPF